MVFSSLFGSSCIVTETDATGFRPEDGQLDDNGVLIPDGIYTTPDFENTLSYLPRTKAVVKHLYNFMVKIRKV
jgi:type I restriction enzyme, R subunit